MKKIMKKIMIILLSVCVLLVCVSCSKEPEPKPQAVSISTSNILDYVWVEISFGDINIKESVSGFSDITTYYLTCIATIRVKPKGDYLFENASCTCALEKSGDWTPIKSATNPSGLNFLHDWSGVVNLDKEGYGEINIFLYCESNSFKKMHPSSAKWTYSVARASGTVTQN